MALLSALGTSLTQLLGNLQLLKAVLAYHVIPNTVIANTTALAAAGTASTLLTGKSLTMGGTASAVTIAGDTNTVNVVSAAINGVYGSGTVSALRPRTPPPPNPRLPARHRTPRRPPIHPPNHPTPPFPPPQTVVAAVYQVDAVLVPNLPPSPPAATPSFSSISAALGNSKNISTFITALSASGLSSTLMAFKGTIFIPTDTAFAAALKALNMQALQLLMQPALLKSILQYHVTSTVFATPASLAAAPSFTTLSSKSIAVSSE